MCDKKKADHVIQGVRRYALDEAIRELKFEYGCALGEFGQLLETRLFESLTWNDWYDKNGIDCAWFSDLVHKEIIEIFGKAD